MHYSKQEMHEFLTQTGLFEGNAQAVKQLENPVIRRLAEDVYELYEQLDIALLPQWTPRQAAFVLIGATGFITGLWVGLNERKWAQSPKTRVIPGEVIT